MPGATINAGGVAAPRMMRRLDRLDVDRLVEGLAHALSLNGFLPLTLENSSSSRFWSMPRKIVRSSGPCNDLEGSVAAVRRADVLHRNRLHHVDLARHQRGHARGVVADRREDHFVDVAVDLVPVPGRSSRGRAHARLARLAAGTARCRWRVNEAAFSMPLRLSTGCSRLVLLAPVLAHHRRHSVSTSGRIGNGSWSYDVDRVVVDLPDLLDRRDVGLHVGAVGLRARSSENTTSSAVNGVPSWNVTPLRSVEAPDRRRGLLPVR